MSKSLRDPNPTIAIVTDGKFELKGETLEEPQQLFFALKQKKANFDMYIDNGKNSFTLKLKEITDKSPMARRNGNYAVEIADLVGSVVNTHKKELDAKAALASKEVNELLSQLMAGTLKDMDVYSNASKKAQVEIEAINKEFIKNNPTAFYSGVLVSGLSRQKDKETIEALLAMVPELNTSHTRKLKEEIAKSKDVKISDIIKASNVSYKVDTKFDGSAFTASKYLGMLSNGNLVSLNNDKTVTIIDGNGKKVKSFNVSSTEVPGTMAIDSNDNIYVLVPEIKEVESTVRGKVVKRKEVVSYTCDIYTPAGKKAKSFKVEGVKQATGARIADGKLLIADMRGQNIGIFNATTGAKETEVKGMRPCCGILDFSVNSKNEILVANLGAFRVQSYDLTGKQVLAFGSRGNDLSAFHGCCNPVSVAYLSNGAIVTVEKDPTRVKVFSKEGAIAIAGIDEMVKGCSYIPMTVDAKDNLYLASPTKGVVRCVAI